MPWYRVKNKSSWAFYGKRRSLARLESTAADISRGTRLSYNQVVRLLERLIIKEQVGYRKRGSETKPVRYIYPRDILDFCR